MPGLPIPINNLMVGAFPNSVLSEPEAPPIPRADLLPVQDDRPALAKSEAVVPGPTLTSDAEKLEILLPVGCNENSLAEAVSLDSVLTKEEAASLNETLMRASDPVDTEAFECALSIACQVFEDALPKSATNLLPTSIPLAESCNHTPADALAAAVVKAKAETKKQHIQGVELPQNLAALPWLKWFDDSGWNMELPFSRLSAAWIAWILCAVGLVKSISKRTVQRWLAADRIKPWRFHSWITPKDLPSFLIRAKEVLDLYMRVRTGQLDPDEDVWSADEKTSIQARGRASHSPAQPGQVARMEPSYDRNGALQLFAALNVAIGNVIARLVVTKHFDVWAEFIAEVILASVALGKRKIHIILDNGSTHRPKYIDVWLKGWLADRRLDDVQVRIHWLPVRSSWLNQVEIFFSVLQRQALTPNDFPSLDELQTRIITFIKLWNSFPKPVKWSYTTDKMLKKFAGPALPQLAAAK